MIDVLNRMPRRMSFRNSSSAFQLYVQYCCIRAIREAAQLTARERLLAQWSKPFLVRELRPLGAIRHA